MQRLRADIAVGVGSARDPGGGPGTGWEARVLLETAGVVDPRADRDAFVRAGLDVGGLPFGGELLLGAEYGLGSVGPGMRSLTVGGAVPVEVSERFLLTPYVALDVWPVLAGTGGPAVRGHGVEVRWVTCCGTLDAGYRSQPDGSVTTRLAFEVVPTIPSLGALDVR